MMNQEITDRETCTTMGIGHIDGADKPVCYYVIDNRAKVVAVLRNDDEASKMASMLYDMTTSLNESYCAQKGFDRYRICLGTKR